MKLKCPNHVTTETSIIFTVFYGYRWCGVLKHEKIIILDTIIIMTINMSHLYRRDKMGHVLSLLNFEHEYLKKYYLKSRMKPHLRHNFFIYFRVYNYFLVFSLE